MADSVPARRRLLVAPARAFLTRAGRVEARTRDDDVGVAGLAVDGDPLALAGLAPAHEAGRVERLVEQPGAVQRIRDGARAVVARVLEVPVAAAVLVRLVGDAVRGGDRLLDLVGRVRRGDGGLAVGRDLGAVAARRRGGAGGRPAVCAAVVVLGAGRAALRRLLQRACVG